jgi:hypothetical protein
MLADAIRQRCLMKPQAEHPFRADESRLPRLQLWSMLELVRGVHYPATA